MSENARTSKLAKLGKNFVRFFKDIKNELKKVVWPTRKQLINSTVSVLLICLLVGAVIWISDELLERLIYWTLSK